MLISNESLLLRNASPKSHKSCRDGGGKTCIVGETGLLKGIGDTGVFSPEREDKNLSSCTKDSGYKGQRRYYFLLGRLVPIFGKRGTKIFYLKEFIDINKFWLIGMRELLESVLLLGNKR